LLALVPEDGDYCNNMVSPVYISFYINGLAA
jgi:hypothetical protein